MASSKEPTCQCRRHRRGGFNPWLGRSPGGGHGSPLFLPGESLGQTSLEGRSPEGRAEPDVTEAAQHARVHRALEPNT